MTPASTWRFGTEDRGALLAIVLLPLLVALPQLLGVFKADPALYIAQMTQGYVKGVLRGFPYIDPNSGTSTEALGVRAALDWLQGNVPWWNPYSGVGLPLAAEYHPAAFFPLTFLLLLPQGMAWEHLVLQIIAGLGAYALLRQLAVGRLAATAGGVLYGFNGTLAWFAHAAALPVPFLPWLLLGIERARIRAEEGSPGGWRLLAVAMAMSLLAGFPETAYISGLLALAWAIMRGTQAPQTARARFAWRIVLGGIVGIALAAPQILAFFEFLPHADLAGHAGQFAHAALPRESIIPSLIAPFVYGPIFNYGPQWGVLVNVWGSIGGYATLALLVTALYGLLSRADALGGLLAAWIGLALAKTFGFDGVGNLWNLIPGIAESAFFRYAQPSWELALVILAARGIDDIARHRKPRRGAVIRTALFLALALTGTFAFGVHEWPHLQSSAGLRNSAIASFAWAALTGMGCVWLFQKASAPWTPCILTALLAWDAMFMFTIPTLSNPRGGVLDLKATEFLRANVGLQRYFTLGPMQPNYGAFFGIASINHNYLPVSERWAAWVHGHLAVGLPDSIVFDGMHREGVHSSTSELVKKLSAYEWVGVKYVLTSGAFDPFAAQRAAAPAEAPSRVYADETMSIFELRHPGPYFEAPDGGCTIDATQRTEARIDCPAPARLVRRELFFPDWQASVNEVDSPIRAYEGLFQAVEVPAGKSVVRYRYAPAHVGWAWLAMALALAALLLPWDRLRRSTTSR